MASVSVPNGFRIHRNVLQLMRPPNSFARRTFDNRHCGSAHPEKILVWIFDFDTNWKPLRDPYPVQFAFHVRNSGRWQVELALGLNCPSDSLDYSTEALVRSRREINNRFSAGSHVSNFRFAKIRNDVPLARIK